MRSPVSGRRVLVLGGASSGKSAFAERLLGAQTDVVYAATAPRYPGDPEWDDRIARHRARRPASWDTCEVGQTPESLAGLLRTAGFPVLVDSLTLWLTAAMDAVGAWDETPWRNGAARSRLDELTRDLIDAFGTASRPVIAVSDEVGFGLVPQSAGSRRFRDALGRLNQAMAAAADDVTLVVAGLPVRLR